MQAMDAKRSRESTPATTLDAAMTTATHLEKSHGHHDH
jgi:hypothetical protein